jgi:hypothetical protein
MTQTDTALLEAPGRRRSGASITAAAPSETCGSCERAGPGRTGDAARNANVYGTTFAHLRPPDSMPGRSRGPIQRHKLTA